MQKFFIVLASALLLSHSVAFGAERINIAINNIPLTVETAKTVQELETGLMHRTELKDGTGMLFFFKEPDRYCMWMKNTLIPLSVAFISSSGKIINIEHMQPQSLNLHCANEPASFALEVPYGWFEKKNISVGDTVNKKPPTIGRLSESKN